MHVHSKTCLHKLEKRRHLDITKQLTAVYQFYSDTNLISQQSIYNSESLRMKYPFQDGNVLTGFDKPTYRKVGITSDINA